MNPIIVNSQIPDIDFIKIIGSKYGNCVVEKLKKLIKFNLKKVIAKSNRKFSLRFRDFGIFPKTIDKINFSFLNDHRCKKVVS